MAAPGGVYVIRTSLTFLQTYHVNEYLSILRTIDYPTLRGLRLPRISTVVRQRHLCLAGKWCACVESLTGFSFENQRASVKKAPEQHHTRDIILNDTGLGARALASTMTTRKRGRTHHITTLISNVSKWSGQGWKTYIS